MQLDNSNAFDAVQSCLFERYLCGTQHKIDFADQRSFLFDSKADKESSDLLISQLIFLLLLFEGHGYVVSSASQNGECLAIQDGFVYFSSNKLKVSDAKDLIKCFERDPLMAPQWIIKIIEEN